MGQVTAYAGLRDFIQIAGDLGELSVFSGASRELEVGAITEIAYGQPGSPMCLFTDIDGCGGDYRVLTNVLSGAARESRIYGTDPALPVAEAMRQWKARSQALEPVAPRMAVAGPVQENHRDGADVDLSSLPFLRWHEGDGGGYLCATAVTMRDPDSGYLNLGCYRFQYVDETRMVCHIGSGHNGDVIRKMYWAQGRACPVTVSLGHDPALLIAAGGNSAYGVSEYGYAGGLRGEPVDLLVADNGVPMPADAELVLEADLLPPDAGMTPEGPFGEASGYYGGGVHDAPLVQVRGIWQRDNPIVLGSPPMPGPDRELLGSRAVEVWKELDGLGIPHVTAVNYGWGLTIIALRQMFPGHAMRAAHGALGGTAGYHGRVVIVVDEDVDVYDPAIVLWAIATRCDPETSIDIARRIWSYRIDPRLSPDKRAAGDLTGSVAIIDACRPFHWKDSYPEVTGISAELRAATLQRWGSQLQQRESATKTS
jgi:UbiD family decarboxylase